MKDPGLLSVPTIAFLCALTINSPLCMPAFAAPQQVVKVKAGVTSKSILPEKGRGKRLDAKVELNEEFPPMPDSLLPGASYQDSEVVNHMPASEDRWYQIPDWLAGEFSYGDQTRYLVNDLDEKKITHPNDVTKGVSSGRHRGVITDKAGHIWQLSLGKWIGDPGHPNGEPGDYDYKRFENDIIGYIQVPDTYIESSDGVEFFVSKKTGKIAMVERYERTRTFKHEPDGGVGVDVREEKYAVDGHPMVIIEVHGPMHKQHDYVALKPGDVTRKGTYDQLALSLKDFMAKVGKSADAPDVAVVEVSTGVGDTASSGNPSSAGGGSGSGAAPIGGSSPGGIDTLFQATGTKGGGSK